MGTCIPFAELEGPMKGGVKLEEDVIYMNTIVSNNTTEK
jgi:hypothetical protein